MNAMKDKHRLFLQAFMWKKICGSEDVWEIFRRCHLLVNEEAGTNDEDLVKFIKEINNALKPLDMDIKGSRDELSEKMFYILVNKNNNTISRLASDYNAQETEVLKGIVSLIVNSEDGKISSTDALNLETEGKVLKSKIIDMLQKFVEDGWLCEAEGYYFFTTRAIAELKFFFRENYSDIICICYQCKDIVFQGPVCENCDLKLHSYCMKRSGIKKCPSCREDFYVS